MDEKYAALRRLVRGLRLNRGWTQEQLAEKAGLDYKYYQLFELNRTAAPSLKMLERLAKIFSVQPWVLLCDQPDLIKAHTGLDYAKLPIKQRAGRPRARKCR
ncbi:MAG: helix-turn-helix domain-containing protein [Verrucomicrobiales bacterium]|jgi:transcriptional regulator with XRE-family HTH domain|nr:helix-turn-helix domain-containing protein [Verrucomicrobiales bacterium]MDR1305003.1 helix-turn-helix domain-containing protein [Verrucomicrobiales bacterium]